MAAKFDSLLGSLRISDFSWVSTPASPSSAGNAGDLAYDTTYFYVCVAPNTWLRTLLSTWTPPAGTTGQPMGMLLSLTYPS